MEGAGAVLAEGAAVLWRGVALMGGEPVLRVESVQLAHERIAVNFGNDGGGGDGEGERVAVEEPGLGAGVVDAQGVDEEVIGRAGKSVDRGEHGEAGGLVDVDPVDGLGVDGGDRDGESAAFDAFVEPFPIFAGELFGVGEAGAGEGAAVAREDDGSGDDGAKECATADLVHAGDGLKAVVAKRLLGCVGADEGAEHLLLGGGAGEAEEHVLASL